LEEGLASIEAALSTNTITEAQDAVKQLLETIHELNDGLNKNPPEWTQAGWNKDEKGVWCAYVGARNAAHHQSDVVVAIYSDGVSDSYLRWELPKSAIDALHSKAQQQEYNARLRGNAVMPELRAMVSRVTSSIA
jgi:hypothetical protein